MGWELNWPVQVILSLGPISYKNVTGVKGGRESETNQGYTPKYALA